MKVHYMILHPTGRRFYKWFWFPNSFQFVLNIIPRRFGITVWGEWENTL